MKLIVYKGFDINFLNNLSDAPLIEGNLLAKKDVLKFDKKVKRKLATSLLEMDDNDEFWISYEEYALIKDQVALAIKDYNLKLVIYVNNLYPDSEMSRQYNFAALLLWNVLFPVVSFYPPVPYVFPALFYNSIILMARPLGIVFLMKTLFSHWLQCLSHASHIFRKCRSERYLLLGKGMNKAHPISVKRCACDILRCGAARYFISGVQHAAFGYSFIT